MKKIVIAGGTGFLGTCLINHYAGSNVEITVLTRSEKSKSGNVRFVTWDGKSPGPWCEALEHADTLINLNGKSVDCRYTEKNKALIYSTRLESTAALGSAILKCKNPPGLWINAASATIYRHSLDKEMDEQAGEIGSGFSVGVCQQWEQMFNGFATAGTRKVLIRTAIVLGKTGGALVPLKRLAFAGMGGKQGPGNQYFSWLHESDFTGIIDFIMGHTEMSGVYNLAAPLPVPNEQLMKTLRSVVGIPFGLPLPKWLLEAGAVLIGTETELILKSRRVIPRRLLEADYAFRFDHIEAALADLL